MFCYSPPDFSSETKHYLSILMPSRHSSTASPGSKLPGSPTAAGGGAMGALRHNNSNSSSTHSRSKSDLPSSSSSSDTSDGGAANNRTSRNNSIAIPVSPDRGDQQVPTSFSPPTPFEDLEDISIEISLNSQKIQQQRQSVAMKQRMMLQQQQQQQQQQQGGGSGSPASPSAATKEMVANNLKKKQQEHQQQLANSNVAAAAAGGATTTKKQQPNNNNNNDLFVKVPVVVPLAAASASASASPTSSSASAPALVPTMVTSELTNLLAPGRGGSVGPGGAAAAAAAAAAANKQKMMSVKCFFAFAQDSRSPHQVQVPETCTVEDVIKAALKKYKDDTGANVPFESSNGYILRVAESDGTQDDDLPALEKKTSIRRLGFDTFVLLVNQNYKASAAEEAQGRRRSIGDLNAVTAATGTRSRGRSGVFSAGGHPAAASAAAAAMLAAQNGPPLVSLEDVRLRVTMPYKPPTVKNIMVAPDMMMKDLMSYLSDKFGLDPEKHVVKILVDGSRELDIPPTLNDKTIRNLQIEEVVLKRKYDDSNGMGDASPISAANAHFHLAGGSAALGGGGGGAPTSSGGVGGGGGGSQSPYHNGAPGSSGVNEKSFFFTNETASQYKEFEVIKVNKYSQRQERILGINKDKLYNMIPKTNKKTKNPERSIDDIVAVKINEEKPCHFTIEFNIDRGRDTETLYYEARTNYEAGYIVAKIKYLMNMRRQELEKLQGEDGDGAGGGGGGHITPRGTRLRRGTVSTTMRSSRRMSIKFPSMANVLPDFD